MSMSGWRVNDGSVDAYRFNVRSRIQARSGIAEDLGGLSCLAAQFRIVVVEAALKRTDNGGANNRGWNRESRERKRVGVAGSSSGEVRWHSGIFRVDCGSVAGGALAAALHPDNR